MSIINLKLVRHAWKKTQSVPTDGCCNRAWVGSTVKTFATFSNRMLTAKEGDEYKRLIIH